MIWVEFLLQLRLFLPQRRESRTQNRGGKDLELELLMADFMQNDQNDSVTSENCNVAAASTLFIGSAPFCGTDLSQCCPPSTFPPGHFQCVVFQPACPERRDFSAPPPPLPCHQTRFSWTVARPCMERGRGGARGAGEGSRGGESGRFSKQLTPNALLVF